MSAGWIVGAELGAIALALGFTAWVLVAQPLALVRTMPRARFVGLQMKVVRAWSRSLVPLSAVTLVAALLRTHHGGHVAAAASAFVAAALAAGWVIPRALRAGGASLRDDEDHDLDGARFLSEGGGDRTRGWHRAVLACVVVLLAGLILDGRDALAALGAPDHHRAHVAATTAPTDRAVADAATAAAIGDLERRTAALLAAGGEGSAAPVRAAWQRIFEVCTMQGEDHERLHAFLAPLAPHVASLEGAQGDARRAPLRAVLAQLGRFDAQFAVAR